MPAKTPKKDIEFEEAAALLTQPDTVVGYQYNPETGEYRGEYTFPNNKDKVEIHYPPNTVTMAPPSFDKKTQTPFWLNGAWELRPREDKLHRPPGEEALKLKLPVLTKVQVKQPGKSGEFMEDFVWVQEEVTPEGELQKAQARQAAFHAQQREWGLE